MKELATGTFHQVDMEGGTSFELPGVRGRMERLEFNSGVVLYRVEYQSLEDCTIEVQNSFDQPWLGSAMHLQGRSELTHPNGNTYSLNQDAALLMRVDASGSRFQLTEGQLIRHVGVATTLASLKERLGGALPDRLSLFDDDTFGEFQAGQSFAPSPRLRLLGGQLFDAHARGTCRSMKLEGIANLFLAEIIELFCTEVDEDDSMIVWENQALSDVHEYCRNNLDGDLSLQALAKVSGLTESRLDQLFRNKYHLSCAEYIRNERMVFANQLLEEEQLPIKLVAAKVGYNHVSNFSRAYKSRYGESPARTQRRVVSQS
ncbi:helix-turn-helix domain-containing protein [Marinobacter salinexigens]|nr:helix-turn-helix domain-containing protein [Marinobacter salinexigens]